MLPFWTDSRINVAVCIHVSQDSFTYRDWNSISAKHHELVVDYNLDAAAKKLQMCIYCMHLVKFLVFLHIAKIKDLIESVFLLYCADLQQILKRGSYRQVFYLTAQKIYTISSLSSWASIISVDNSNHILPFLQNTTMSHCSLTFNLLDLKISPLHFILLDHCVKICHNRYTSDQ